MNSERAPFRRPWSERCHLTSLNTMPASSASSSCQYKSYHTRYTAKIRQFRFGQSLPHTALTALHVPFSNCIVSTVVHVSISRSIYSAMLLLHLYFSMQSPKCSQEERRPYARETDQMQKLCCAEED
ncbi:hypothetical protein L207DRAFT_195424 [Hyaloscypha variabilis F]|uniref:Uncharacterized protein n=1 Tax=Hyaloscypha variabilis (strain UAMH 11265 / GT02V1 / F) TaxID=1149755 RepID=A0A2J6QYS3_HYAVF|nr:hypothetical protein L207DRAFT_195424 [Hyaloscypha variabilis F]